MADHAVAKVADDVWNAIGRPANDGAYEVLFPGGSAYYVKGDVEEQPLRMALLSRLLRSGVHPRLDVATAKRAVQEAAKPSADPFPESLSDRETIEYTFNFLYQ